MSSVTFFTSGGPVRARSDKPTPQHTNDKNNNAYDDEEAEDLNNKCYHYVNLVSLAKVFAL